MAPAAEAPSAHDSFARQALHVAALSALAVAQPVFDVVRRDSEFLVAHRVGRPDLLLFVLALIALVPAVPIAAAWTAGRVSRRAQQAVTRLAVFLLLALIGVQALNATVHWPALPALTAAVACAGLLTRLYARSAPVQSYVSLLGLAIPLVPTVFLLNPAISGFWRPVTVKRPSAPPPHVSTPIVMVVFDQFPTVSLLDEAGQIDGRLFPAIAGLARQSTWYRNATAVSDRTGFALPAMLTGRYPRRGQLPRTEHLPENLFTWLGQRYRVWAREPLTSVCPTEICGREVGPILGRATSMLSDVAAVYLHIVAPPDLRERLPPVNQGWRDFRLPLWQRRAIDERAADRRAPFLDLIEALGPPSARPALYFAHVLLPHEPFIYYPSGRVFAGPDEPILGLGPTERWTTDWWPVALSYQRHLSQARMVDGLVGALLDRMRAVGLYDHAVLVITADHGASFRPGANFKGPGITNFAEIMSVPLLVKAPGQTTADVDDTNIETIDVLPTIADILGAPVPWEMQGVSGRRTARRTGKRICHTGCTVWQEHSPEAVRDGRDAAVAEKLRLFGSPVDPERPPVDAAAAALLGRSTESLVQTGEPRWRARLDVPWQSDALPAVSSFVPGLLTGVATPTSGTRELPLLAVALDGVVRGLSPLYRPAGSDTALWAILLPEPVAAARPSHLELFEALPGSDGEFALRRVDAPGSGDADVNLLSVAAAGRHGVRTIGLYPPETTGPGRLFRWTEADARLDVPVDPERPVRRLTVGIGQNGPPGRPLRIRVNGCQVFAGPMPQSPWRGQFSVESCVSGRRTVTIELSTEAWVPGNGDRRRLGAGLDYIALTR